MNATAAVLCALAALVFLWAAASWVARWPMFSIRAIRIDGDVARNSAATIRANALPRMSGNLFTMDLARSQQAFQAVPWVRQAVVRRVWPNRLAVTLEEHVPVAYWRGAKGEDRIVNSFGEVFEANLGDVEDENLPTLIGPEGSAARVLALYREVAPVLARLGSPVVQLGLSERGHWHAELDDGARIELGRGSAEEVLARIDRLVATIGQVTARYPGPLEYADLRHRDGYAVRIRGVTTQTTPAARN
ncbi:MAG: cell division protein FtsQ/DivIB [Caldimonas sp.]|uniref:cell division protein FtsQ/DivIB n=1 Tax=Caldimonas sp. TaxID=2838790 RepID=UPI00391BA694